MNECDYCGQPGHHYSAHPVALYEVARWQREQRAAIWPFGDHKDGGI